MKIKGLDDPQGLQERGRQSLLFVERKARLDALYAEYRKYSDLAQQNEPLVDVQEKMNQLMDEIEEINRMLRK